MSKVRTVVAMSGGVDSSVVAALLQEAGHDLVGVTLHLWDGSGAQTVGRCCAPEDREDARRTCEHLGIPHYVFDERESFEREVVQPFVDQHRKGHTPSPCAACNRLVKLDRLVTIATRLGCEHIATGHYAQIIGERGQRRLFRGADREKDQSYFLYGLRSEVLDRLLTPLGKYDKTWTRAQGQRLGVPSWQKKDSQELCFIPDGDTESFLRRRGVAFEVGEVVDEAGMRLGEHHGLPAYTVGQRRGLGIGGGPARYVVRREGEGNRLVVGDEDALLGRRATVGAVRWLQEAPREPFRAAVRIRHRHEPAPARIDPAGATFEVFFDEPQRAITAGQIAVVYREEEVLGGGLLL